MATAETAFKASFERVSLLTGEDFFKNLTRELNDALKADAVWVAQLNKSQNSMSTLAFIHLGKYLPNFTYLLDDTPCEKVINSSTTVHFPEKLIDLFPNDAKMLSKFSGESYVGTSLHDVNGEVIGNLALLHSKPILKLDAVTPILKVVKARADAELQRLRREKEILNRENLLTGLVNGLQDLLINLDSNGKILLLNSVAETTLGINPSNPSHISQFLNDEGKSKLLTLIEKLGKQENANNYTWIPGTLEINPLNHAPFKAEGTISRYELDQKVYYTLVLSNLNGKHGNIDRISHIIDETEFIRGEMLEIKETNQLVGECPQIKRLLQNIYMVAHTDATVLVNGETGTGKELVARHIHQVSNRKNKPMITVNCGAIPHTLIESEFFGHAKGAFTGATGERKGRFQMADGGTIFLDEVGELPFDLQVKLLRVIQENEFEPVGSSQTVKVDVRIIAATHRNLFELISENKFREDLYYRLNVFPVEAPPLRERGDDIILIANTFIRKFANRMNKKINPLSHQEKILLLNYKWPGNIRELQNIIERSVILSADGTLNLCSILGGAEIKQKQQGLIDDGKILTKNELVEFEKQNIIKALKAADWRVSGKDGAAALLQMVPSTLTSRISALGIKMP